MKSWTNGWSKSVGSEVRVDKAESIKARSELDGAASGVVDAGSRNGAGVVDPIVAARLTWGGERAYFLCPMREQLCIVWVRVCASLMYVR